MVEETKGVTTSVQRWYTFCKKNRNILWKFEYQ